MAEADESDNHNSTAGPRISPLRLALRNFTSQWFLAPQGTGILAVILHQLHYQFSGLKIISEIIWVLTIVLLASMLLIYLLRAALYPSHVRKQLRTNIMETACLASISIAFTTIIQMTALNLVQDWGKAWGTVVLVLWWINLVVAVAAVTGIPYIFTTLEASGIDHIPVAIRLPPIAALTVAAGGGVVCRYGQLDADLQVPVIIVSYLCVGAGLFLAVMCDAAFLVRVFDSSWPTGKSMYSIMIGCGPYGQSSFAMQILGDVVRRGAFAKYDASPFVDSTGGRIVATCSVLVGVLLWGYGTFWWAFACIAIVHDLSYRRDSLLSWDQHLGAWSLVFPWGVYTNAAVEFGNVILKSEAFNIWSTVLTLLLVILWLFNMGASITGAINGKVFGLDRGWRATYIDTLAAKQS